MIPFAAAPQRSCSWRNVLRFVLALGAVASLALPTRRALADDDREPVAAGAADAADADRVARAQALFDSGRELLQEGQAELACPELEESQRLEPAIGTQLNLAACYEQVGKLASAHALFLSVAEAARGSGQAQREQIARERASAIEPRVSKLRVAVPPIRADELRVERDGERLDRDQWNVALPVDPGLHHVRASGPGLEEWSTEVQVAADGSVQEVAVVVSDARAFFDPLHRKLGLAAGAVGVAGVVVGSIFGARAVTKKNEAARAGCDGRECDSPESAAIRDEARSAGNVATAAMVVGAGGLAAAAVLLWVMPEPSPERVAGVPRDARLRLSPGVVARGGVLWLQGSF